MNMIEKVARAIDSEIWERWDNWVEIKGYNADEKAEELMASTLLFTSMDRARAAIEAMMEPNEAMLEYEIDQDDLHNTVKTDGELIWEAMIKAAMEE